MCTRALSRRLQVIVHNALPPADDEWAAHCNEARELRARWGKLDTLVLTPHGAGPNAAQRKLYAEVVGADAVRVAVMTDSRAARAILTAMSWFNSNMRSFGTHDLSGALQYLGVADGADIRDTLREMAVLLGLSQTDSVAPP